MLSLAFECGDTIRDDTKPDNVISITPCPLTEKTICQRVGSIVFLGSQCVKNKKANILL